MSNPDTNTVGGRIKAKREAKGLNQHDLAQELGVPQGTVSKWEGGRSRLDADLMRVRRIASVLDTTPCVLLGLVDDGEAA